MPENHKQTEEALRRSRDAATAINRLLSFSLENVSLQEFLEKAVELILSISWLVFEAKGSIFLLENGSLVLKAQNGLEETFKKECARLPLGRCLCGRAALTGEVQYAAGIDERHEIYFEEMEPHGHYCIPIKSPEKIYGVLNLYLHEGHRRDEKDEEFLIAFADALAGVIERKQAEKALRKNEKKFRAIFDMSQDAMYLHDLEGKIITVNQTACERLGYSSGELKGMLLTDIVSPKDAALIAERMEKLLATGRHIFETTDVSKDGKVIPVEVNATIIDYGSARAVLSASRDITVRKKAEEKIRTLNEELEQRVEERTAALRESEQKYRYMTENIKDVIWTVDLEGNLTYMSPAIEKLIGFTVEEIMAMPINEYIVQDDYNALLTKLTEELAKPPAERDRSVIMPARHRTKDNRLVHAELSASWIIDEQGNLIGVQGTTRDITERKKLEKQIIESRKMYQSVVDTQQEMISRYMPDTSLTFVNDAYCRYYGKNRQEILGHRFLEFTPPELHDEILEVINSLTPDNPSVRHEHYVLLPDGSTAWQEWTDQAMFDEKGKVIEIQRVGHDITERVQAEGDLLQAYDATIEGWAHALDLKDKETEGHSQRVTERTVDIARHMGMKDEELAHVRRGALLHDIGKMGIPDAILLKPGKLSEEEWAVMKKHPAYAYEMLAPVDYLRPALDIPYCHHEKWDGTGYPRGLKGKAIPLSARIFAVVDVYDALTSDRPYRKAWSEEDALALIKEESGSHFDPQVVEVFLKTINHNL